MPPKKAAKKLASRHADPPPAPHLHKDSKHHEKKHHGKDKKHGKKHHEEKDTRRAYEHLGRLNALQKSLAGRTVNQVKMLISLAQQALLDEDAKCAADLLRAAEHLAFGSLAQTTRATRLSEPLEAALNAELEHLEEKSAEHWKKREQEHPPQVVELYASMLAISSASRVKGAYRRALEFARGAEALAHVRLRTAQDATLDDGDDPEADLTLADDPV